MAHRSIRAGLLVAAMSLVAFGCGGGGSDEAKATEVPATDAAPDAPPSQPVLDACDQIGEMKDRLASDDPTGEAQVQALIGRYWSIVAGSDPKLTEIIDQVQATAGDLSEGGEVVPAAVEEMDGLFDDIVARCDELGAPTSPQTDVRKAVLALCLTEVPLAGIEDVEGVQAMADTILQMRANVPGAEDSALFSAVEDLVGLFDGTQPAAQPIETALGTGFDPISVEPAMRAFTDRCTALSALNANNQF